MLKQVMGAATTVFGVILAVIFTILPVQAAPIQYFHAQIPVKSQGSVDRNRAASIGLKNVLVRVSGSTNVTGSPAVLRTLGNAGKFIEQFDYIRADGDENGYRYKLNMTFAPSLVERLLSEAGLPFWPINRPKVLVWLVLDDPEQGRLLLNDPENHIVQALESAAHARGVPLLFPLLDLDDQLAVNAQQIWDRQEQTVQNASVRYGVDTILIGRLAQSSQGTWLTTWEFFHRDIQRVYDARSEVIEGATNEGVKPLADYLAAMYSVRSSGAAQPRLYAVVEDVTEFSDFGRMTSYMEGLALVSKFEVLRVNGDQVFVMLELSGSLVQLHNTFGLDGLIQAEDLTARAISLGTPLEPLHFFWRGR